MRKHVLSAALVVALAASLASGQWQVEYAPLPDSMYGVRTPRCVLYNPGNNTVFVSGDGDAIVVLDGVTGRKVARIPVEHSVGAMCYNPVQNRMYALAGTELLAIDAAAQRIVGSVPVGEAYRSLCYNPTVNRVYCVGGSSVVAVDCIEDTVVSTVTLPAYSEDICCNPAGNKVYCVMSNDDVAVIDCASDSIIKTFYTGAGEYCMLYNPLNNRLYISEVSDEDVAIIDCDRDSVLRYLPAGYGPDTMCLNTASNKVYVADAYGELLFIIDGAGDSLIGWRAIGEQHYGITYDSVDNLVYLAFGDSLAVIDGMSDSVAARLKLDYCNGPMCYNPRQNFVYATGRSAAVEVLRGRANQRVAWQRLWCGLTDLVYRAAGDEVVGLSGRELAAFDQARMQVDRFVTLDRDLSGLHYVPALDKFYGIDYSSSDTLLVIHGASDSIIRIPGAPGRPLDLCYASGAGKVYCCSDWSDSSLTVLDAEADTVLGRVRLDGTPGAIEYSAEHNQVFVTVEASHSLWVIDAGSDSVVAVLPVSYPARLCYVPGYRLLFCTGAAQNALVAIDADSSRIIDTVLRGVNLHEMTYSRSEGELYVGYSPGVYVVDLAALALSESIVTDLSGARLECDTMARRLYCSGTHSRRIAVIDLRGDSLIPAPQVPDYYGEAILSQRDHKFFLSYPGLSMMVVVSDTLPVGMSGGATSTRRRATPTIVRGVLWLNALGTLSELPGRNSVMSRTVLLDVSGRNLMELQAGANDMSRLSPGVYFVREEPQAPSSKSQAVRKVILAK